MEQKKSQAWRYLVGFGFAAVILIIAACTTNADSVQESVWALIPPLIAIVLALFTKEVYSSLFIGIFAGALIYSGFNLEDTVNHTFQNGFLAVLSDTYNLGILIFLIILGMIVCMMNKAGGSAAFGQWAATHIKSRAGAQIATIVLGILIFIDDYFNCLTVGSVMRPVTDKHKISRAKLAYLIDATAAPICIIAPISSWAAAVSGYLEGEKSMSVFIRTIPFNYYALLTIVFMFAMVKMKSEYGPMKRHEENALKGDIYTTPDRPYAGMEEEVPSPRGKVMDLLIPVVILVVCCLMGILYAGEFFHGATFMEAFENTDASYGLVLGSFVALIIIIIFYLIRRVLSFEESMKALPDGFKAMVPAILILTFAWTLKAMTDSLGAKAFVAGVIEGPAKGLMFFLPAIIFLIAVFLSFSTGTSWGTFGILIPIVIHAFQNLDPTLMMMSMSACMAGAVCGDHCSPISDTTIMSSAGAQCNHVNHVSTQIPYAMTVAAISFVVYLFNGLLMSFGMSNPVIPGLIFGIVLTILIPYILSKRAGNIKIDAPSDEGQ